MRTRKTTISDWSGKNTKNYSYQKYIHGIGICYVCKIGRMNNYIVMFGWKLNNKENRIFKESKANQL